MGLLEGKVCVVTGAGGGIGSVICKMFVVEGAEAVIAVDLTAEAVELWKQEDPAWEKVVAYGANIVHEQEVKSLVQQVKKNYGRIDVLVNAAGIEFNEKIGMISYANMEKTFGVNVLGLIELTQYTSRVMARQRCGSIVNIASVVGVRGNPGQSVYAASKGAVIAFTKSAAKELAPMGIRVNAIAPGLTDTPMIRKTSQEGLESRISRISLGRMAAPEDIANAVVYLASEKAGFVTGHVLHVDGGTVM